MRYKAIQLILVLFVVHSCSTAQHRNLVNGKIQEETDSFEGYPDAVKPCLAAMQEIEYRELASLIAAKEIGEGCAISLYFMNQMDLDSFVQRRKQAGLSASSAAFKADGDKVMQIPLDLEIGSTVEH